MATTKEIVGELIDVNQQMESYSFGHYFFDKYVK